jgi:hypothetical protein
LEGSLLIISDPRLFPKKGFASIKANPNKLEVIPKLLFSWIDLAASSYSKRRLGLKYCQLTTLRVPDV